MFNVTNIVNEYKWIQRKKCVQWSMILQDQSLFIKVSKTAVTTLQHYYSTDTRLWGVMVTIAQLHIWPNHPIPLGRNRENADLLNIYILFWFILQIFMFTISVDLFLINNYYSNSVSETFSSVNLVILDSSKTCN